MGGEWTEVHGSESITLGWRQRHAEDSFFAPLEVQAGDVVISTQWIREEEAVSESPRFILFPRVRHQAVAQLIREVSESILAVLSDVDGDVGDESVWICVFGSELVAANATIGGKVKDIERVWANVASCVANADGSGVQDPETAALVSCLMNFSFSFFM